MEQTCQHPDAWFRVIIPEDGTRMVSCFDCAREYIQDLPVGWTATIERIGE
jgi:hypothetical protein